MKKFVVRLGFDHIDSISWFNRFGPFETQELANMWVDQLWNKLTDGKFGTFEEACGEGNPFESLVQGLVIEVEKIEDPPDCEEFIKLMDW